MPQTKVRTYGRKVRSKRPLALADMDVNSKLKSTKGTDAKDPVTKLTEKLDLVTLQDHHETPTKDITSNLPSSKLSPQQFTDPDVSKHALEKQDAHQAAHTTQDLRRLTWADVCPVGDNIAKIAEASYAEVYRITNDRGTSIIKVIRLESPIKPQTKAQEKSGLVDEEPHGEADLSGELQISEWLADIPGFVVYKERYLVQGKTTPALLETHQTFQRKIKRKDPDRLQFYPSPSRYLKDTLFLVIELGDAGTALEDLEILSTTQIWDVFLHVAVALARAENEINFEHRDLHEGNLCVRQATSPRIKDDDSSCQFGYSGLEITILDYGLSRGEDTQQQDSSPVAFDLEKDLSLFTSTHAKQCEVYRRMRSFLLRGDRICLPPRAHNVPYDNGPEGPISWDQFNSYTNVLWLAYLYEYLTKSYQGDKKEVSKFKRMTRELWSHLDPEAPPETLSFGCAVDIVEFSVEAGWITEDQLIQGQDVEGDASIIEIRTAETDKAHTRRSPRRRQPATQS